MDIKDLDIVCWQAFAEMAVRPAVQQCLRQHVEAFYAGSLAAELDAVKLEFEALRRAGVGDPALPRFAGQAVAAERLLKRLQGSYDAVQVSVLAKLAPAPPHVRERRVHLNSLRAE